MKSVRMSGDPLILEGRGLWPASSTWDLVSCPPARGGREYARRPPSVLAGFDRWARERPEKPALIDGDVSLTFGQIDATSRAAAAWLRGQGVRRGERVALLMANSWRIATVVLAVFRAGGIAVPLNTKLLGGELGFMLKDAEPAVLIVDPEWWPRVEDVVRDLGLDRVVGTEAIRGQRFATVDQMIDDGTALPPVPDTPAEDDPAFIMYTSGTTGLPKGTILTHRNLVHSTLSDIHTLGVTGDDRTVIAMPMFYVTGLIAQLLLLLYCGGTSIVMRRFHAPTLLEKLHDERITFFHAAPTVYTMLLNVPGYERVSLPGWRRAVAGGSATPPDTIDRMRRWVPGTAFCPRYGLTEATSPVSQTPPGSLEGHEAEAGLLVPMMTCQVVGRDGAPLAEGKAGELWVRGPNVTPGYWRNPAATGEVLVDGWLRTGDIVRVHRDGYLHILDRIKDMINRGAEKIYSLEVERVLLEHPAVAQAALVPAPDPIYGEVPRAVLVLHAGAALSAEEARAWVGSRLAKFKVPVFVDVVAELPTNPTGKVMKGVLRGERSWGDEEAAAPGAAGHPEDPTN